MIEAQNLTKIFRDKKRGEIRAVDNVSFRCQPAQIYGLLGANGAGKTTTLRLLATILQPTDGTARVAGFDINDQPEKVRASVGFLSTATALYGRLTARERPPGWACSPPSSSPPTAPPGSRASTSTTSRKKSAPASGSSPPPPRSTGG